MAQPLRDVAWLIDGHVQEHERRHRRFQRRDALPPPCGLETIGHRSRIEDVNRGIGFRVEHFEHLYCY